MEILEKRLRKKASPDGMQFGFMPGKGMTGAIFVVQQLQEKFLWERKALTVLHLWTSDRVVWGD